MLIAYADLWLQTRLAARSPYVEVGFVLLMQSSAESVLILTVQTTTGFGKWLRRI